MLGGLVVHQILPHQGLGDLVSRHGGHGIAHHAAVPADGDVGGAGADIHQAQIQQPQTGRNSRVQSGYGLQCQTGHLQARPPHDGVQAVDDAAGQEGGHHIGLQHPAGMAQQGGEGIAVQRIPGDGIAHQQHPLPAVLHVVEGFFRLGYRGGLQLGHQLLVHRLGSGEGPLCVPPLCAQGPAGGRNAGSGEFTAGGLLQPVGDGPHNVGHLGDILNLAVHHGPLGVELLFNGPDLHPAVYHGAQHPDDAAGADVQRIDKLLPLYGSGRCSSHMSTNSFVPGRPVFHRASPLDFCWVNQYLLKRLSEALKEESPAPKAASSDSGS